MLEVVGREKDLAAVYAFVGGPEGAAALVLEGEAGIGKSTLWLAGVERARELGFRVLTARPAEAERGLAHVGLGDLFDDVLDDVLPALPPPRRHALETALLLEEPQGGAMDLLALGVAVRSSLQALVVDSPLLLAIDDLQWFDPASADALAFALRRVGGHVLLLSARRLGDATQPSQLEEALGAENVRRLAVGPLSAGALHRFLRNRLDRAFPRQTLLRIHEHSGGNPFFALELARALGDDVDPTQPLPVPQTLEDLVRARIAGLPTTTRQALALASALGTPSLSVLERAGVDARALDPAFAAHVIERENGTVRFTHPLLSSVLYADLGDDLPGIHRRIAGVVDDPLVRARHLALSTEPPDADVAAVLDGAVTLAEERAASALAAELAEHALRLTTVDDADARHRRALAAARAHQAAGEWLRARALGAGMLAEAAAGPPRAEILLLLAELEVDELAIPLLEQALAEAAGRPDLESRIKAQLAWASRFRKGFPAAVDDARDALALADDLDDDTLRLEPLMTLSVLGGAAGDPEAVAFAQRAREIAVAAGNAALLAETITQLAQALTDSGDLDAAGALLRRHLHEWHEEDDRAISGGLWVRAWVELWSGRLECAADDATRAYEIAAQYGVQRHQDMLPAVWAAVYRGRLELARELGERGLQLCREQMPVPGPLYLGALGLAAFWSGDLATAADRLDEADRVAAALGWGEPNRRPWTADHVEVLLELGRREDALRVLAAWEADAVSRDRRRVLAQVTRCRGLVAAAEGDIDGARRLLEQAVTEHGEVGDAFGRARALVALGIVRRRARQKRAARDAITEAIAGFEEVGAATWIEKARAELGRIGGRTQEEGLTAAERRVAVAAAEGRTNREIAAALFLSERTVAGHLTRIYAKLGVRSRTELARKVERF